MNDPIALFQMWLREAVASGLKDPTAMSLSTVDAEGVPDVRMVLMKGLDPRGFVFYTNLGSPKAQALQRNPHAALCFYWMPLAKQVRVRGGVEAVSDEEADVYFSTRARLSQLGAWASKQSSPMESPAEFENEAAKIERRFADREVPRPPFWSGFRVVPQQIEFWTEKPFRRHERILYTRDTDGWKSQWLFP